MPTHCPGGYRPCSRSGTACSWTAVGFFQPRAAADSASCAQTPRLWKAAAALVSVTIRFAALPCVHCEVENCKMHACRSSFASQLRKPLTVCYIIQLLQLTSHGQLEHQADRSQHSSGIYCRVPHNRLPFRVFRHVLFLSISPSPGPSRLHRSHGFQNAASHMVLVYIA